MCPPRLSDRRTAQMAHKEEVVELEQFLEDKQSHGDEVAGRQLRVVVRAEPLGIRLRHIGHHSLPVLATGPLLWQGPFPTIQSDIDLTGTRTNVRMQDR